MVQPQIWENFSDLREASDIEKSEASKKMGAGDDEESDPYDDDFEDDFLDSRGTGTIKSKTGGAHPQLKNQEAENKLWDEILHDEPMIETRPQNKSATFDELSNEQLLLNSSLGRLTSAVKKQPEVKPRPDPSKVLAMVETEIDALIFELAPSEANQAVA